MFRMYDIDENGFLSKEEFLRMLRYSPSSPNVFTMFIDLSSEAAPSFCAQVQPRAHFSPETGLGLCSVLFEGLSWCFHLASLLQVLH